MVLAFAPFGLLPVALVALAVLAHLWITAASPRVAAGTGFVFGMGMFLAGVSWVYISLHRFGAMPMPLAAGATLLFCAFLALFPALVTFAAIPFGDTVEIAGRTVELRAVDLDVGILYIVAMVAMDSCSMPKPACSKSVRSSVAERNG